MGLRKSAQIREIEVLSDKEPARVLDRLPDIVIRLPAEAFMLDVSVS
jgi:hypothetical protein